MENLSFSQTIKRDILDLGKKNHKKAVMNLKMLKLLESHERRLSELSCSVGTLEQVFKAFG